jgi:hypothetical protein
MISVKINGTDSSIKGDGLPRMADLVELIKASIDPDHMITGILVNGRELDDEEWYANTSRFGTAIVEVQTGTPESFVSERLGSSGQIVNCCYMEFRNSRKKFQDGDMQGGNQALITAVRTLRAFFEWYATLMELVPEGKRKEFDIDPHVNMISETCKKICQQQLYQSWWALGESIEKELEPQLDKLEDFCRKIGKSFTMKQ